MGNLVRRGDSESAAPSLTFAEKERLRTLEIKIADGLQTFVEVGNALLEVRDNTLYRDTFTTFEAYCRERWGMSRFYAHRLMGAATIAQNLLPIGNMPDAESQVRPLAGLPPEQQREAWAVAVESAPAGRPTARQVQEAVTIVTRRVIDPEPAVAEVIDDPEPEAEPEPCDADDGFALEPPAARKPAAAEDDEDPAEGFWRKAKKLTDEVLVFVNTAKDPEYADWVFHPRYGARRRAIYHNMIMLRDGCNAIAKRFREDPTS